MAKCVECNKEMQTGFTICGQYRGDMRVLLEEIENDLWDALRGDSFNQRLKLNLLANKIRKARGIDLGGVKL